MSIGCNVLSTARVSLSHHHPCMSLLSLPLHEYAPCTVTQVRSLYKCIVNTFRRLYYPCMSALYTPLGFGRLARVPSLYECVVNTTRRPSCALSVYECVMDALHEHLIPVVWTEPGHPELENVLVLL